MAIYQRNIEAVNWINSARTALLNQSHDVYGGTNNPGDYVGFSAPYGEPYYILENQTTPGLNTSYELDQFDLRTGARRHIFISARSGDGGTCYAAIYKDGVQLTSPISFTDQHWKVYEVGSFVPKRWISNVFEKFTLRVWSGSGNCHVSLMSIMARSVTLQAENYVSGDGVLINDANANPASGNNAIRSPNLAGYTLHTLATIPNVLGVLYSPGVAGYELLGVAHVHRMKTGGGQPWVSGYPYKQEADSETRFSVNTPSIALSGLVIGNQQENYSLGYIQDATESGFVKSFTGSNDLVIWAYGESNPPAAALYQQFFVDKYIINREVNGAYYATYPANINTIQSTTFTYTDPVPDLHTHYELRIIDPITEIEVFYDALLPAGFSYTLYGNTIPPGTYRVWLLAYYVDGSYGWDYATITVAQGPIAIASMAWKQGDV